MTEAGPAGRRLADALQEAGLDTGAAVLWPAPTADSPPPPEGPWVVLPLGDGFVVGAMSRGRLAQYDQVETFERAAMLVIRLLQEPAARHLYALGGSSSGARPGSERTSAAVVAHLRPRTAPWPRQDAQAVLAPAADNRGWAVTCSWR